MIRKAKVEDAEEISDVIKMSITELCELDHKGDEAAIEEWLENKTIENCERWIANDNLNTFVAVENDRIIGVSTIGNNGHLFLLYLFPEVKGKGVGAELLLTAENYVIELGVGLLTLESTVTAKYFYEHFGYLSVGKTKSCLKYEKSVSLKVLSETEKI